MGSLNLTGIGCLWACRGCRESCITNGSFEQAPQRRPFHRRERYVAGGSSLQCAPLHIVCMDSFHAHNIHTALHAVEFEQAVPAQGTAQCWRQPVRRAWHTWMRVLTRIVCIGHVVGAVPDA